MGLAQFSVLVLVAWLFSSCASVQPIAHPPDDEQWFVRLQALPPSQGRERNHPLQLSPDDWITVLGSVRVQTRKDTFLFSRAKNPPAQAFSPEEIGYLSGQLSRAFAQASPSDIVVFGLSRVLSPQMNEVTTGGWFAEDGNLHLLLANYRHSVLSSAAKRLWQDPVRRDSAPYYDILVEQHQSAPKQSLFAEMTQTDPAELVIDHKALLATAAPSESSQKIRPRAQETVPPSSSAGSVEDRLRLLKRFRDQGLITEEEYRLKKQQLLEKF